MFFKINADILFFYLFKSSIYLLCSYISGCTGQNAIACRTEFVFCSFQFLFEVCAKVDKLNVAQIGNIICAIRFESHVFRNRLDQCDLLCQLVNLIKGQREIIQLRRSIEPSRIIAEFILNCCTGFLHSNQMLRIHKRFIPKLKSIVQLLVRKNSRVARFLRFFQ